MNYITHLNAVFSRIGRDNRLNPPHFSLYMALFHFWNMNQFCETFHISREELMKWAKIGSTSTYHRCIKDLHNWKYVEYLPSHSAYIGSRVKMFDFTKHDYHKTDTTSGTTTATTPKLRIGPNINMNKHDKTIYNYNKRARPKNKNQVLNFFKKNNWSAVEGKKFYNHYSSIGWKIGGKIDIVDWKSAAENWVLKAEEFKKKKRKKKGVSQKWDNLKTTKDKDYDEPL